MHPSIHKKLHQEGRREERTFSEFFTCSVGERGRGMNGLHNIKDGDSLKLGDKVRALVETGQMDGITRRKQWGKKGKRKRINNEEEDKLKYAVAVTSNKVYLESKVKRKGKRKKGKKPLYLPRRN